MRGPRGRLAALAALAAVLSASCGYAPVHAGVHQKLHVALVESKVPDAAATDEVLVGAREELARMGALAPGDGYPRLEIEVLRADEASEGIDSAPNQDGRLVPQSRATRVGIVARGWVMRAAAGAGERERDTGDVRAFETVGAAQDARAAAFRQSDALRVAGRRAGKRLAARVLGLPAASDE